MSRVGLIVRSTYLISNTTNNITIKSLAKEIERVKKFF
jgi:hypothetical protein